MKERAGPLVFANRLATTQKTNSGFAKARPLCCLSNETRPFAAHRRPIPTDAALFPRPKAAISFWGTMTGKDPGLRERPKTPRNGADRPPCAHPMTARLRTMFRPNRARSCHYSPTGLHSFRIFCHDASRANSPGNRFPNRSSVPTVKASHRHCGKSGGLMFPGSATPPPALFRPLASMVGSGRLFDLKSWRAAHSNPGSFPPRAFSVEPHAQRYAEAGDGTETPGKNHSRQPEKPRSKDARQRDSFALEPAHARHNALGVRASHLTEQTLPTRQP